MISINYPRTPSSLLKKVCFGGWYSPNHFILVHKIKTFLKNLFIASPFWMYRSPRRQAERETAFSFVKKGPFWKHLSEAGIIKCFPPSLCCSQSRQGEASLPCEQGLQNSPFIIKAAELADANRLPPFLLNCKINFRGWGHHFCIGKSYISQLYALVAKCFLPRMGHNSRGVPPYSAFPFFFCCRLQLHVLDSLWFHKLTSAGGTAPLQRLISSLKLLGNSTLPA